MQERQGEKMKMRHIFTDMCDELSRWSTIKGEWDDKKRELIEEDYIYPVQRLFTEIDDKLLEIERFMEEVIDKMKNCMEENADE